MGVPSRGSGGGCRGWCQVTEHIHQSALSIIKELLDGETSKLFFEQVLHYVIRTEFQGRGTVHFHVAAWVIPMAGLGPERYIGRTGGQQPSVYEGSLLEFLERTFHCSCDVQVGSGYLNYVNGYVVKANDALDYRFKDSIGVLCPGMRGVG